MIGRYEYVRQYPAAFYAMSGMTLKEFDALAEDFLPQFAAAEEKRLARANRKRARGAGHPFALDARDRLLMTLFFLRRYPTEEVLGFFFGVSDSSADRHPKRVLPVLEAMGRATMRMPDPGKQHRKNLDALLRETPALAVIVDSFEQRVQRPQTKETAQAWYSGKKKQHTVKVQVAIDETTGRIVDVSDGVPGPMADFKLLEQSKLMERLPEGVGAIGDLAYVGIDKLHPERRGATPRRKPRGQPRPSEDRAFNRAFSRRRIGVEHGIGKLRTYQALTQTDRHHRNTPAQRVRAVAGLLNRRIV